jgi:glycosyltransferase involved in cell wall biosynthesis
MFYLKGNQPTREDRDWMDFAHFHYAHVAINYRRIGVPFAISPHTNDIFPDHGFRLRVAAKHPNCKFVTYQSKYHKEHFEKWKIPKPHVDLPMCCRTDLFKASTDRLGEQIIAGGRLIPRKGLEKVLPRVNNLRVFGNGPREDYVDYLKSLNKTNKFVGHLGGHTLRDFYSEAWLYLFPAKVTDVGNRDGIPNTIKEALLMGLQVIAAPTSGIPEMEGVTLLEDWSKINEVIEEVPRTFNVVGRNYILNNFSPEACVDKLEAAIKEYGLNE